VHDAGRVTASLDIATLYRTHGHIVLRRARRLLGNDEDARDVLQQVFTSLVREPSRFRGESSFATYLYRATTSTCLQHLRNQRTRASLLATRVAPSQSEAADPVAESLSIVRDLVAQLPDDLARVVIHRFIDGMTYDEIAEQLGCSRRHAGELIARARELLHEQALEEAS
jgi:RNA polymerase sigma factor (sigma-70 family)